MANDGVRTQRIELLKKYYPVDTQNKIVTFRLHYEHASELLDYSIGEKGKEPFKSEFVDKASDLLDKLPADYKGHIILDIDDYDGFDETVIMEKFNDFLELHSFNLRYASKKNAFGASVLLIVGCMILMANAILTTLSLLGNGTLLSNALKEALDITSWVFIWQAVTLLFISPNQGNQSILKFFHKMNLLSMARNGAITLSKNIEELAIQCKIDSTFSYTQKQILAINASLLFFEGMVMTFANVVNAIAYYDTLIWPAFFVSAILAILIIWRGVLSLTRFTNKDIKNKKFVFWFATTGAFAIAYFILNIYYSTIAQNIFNLIFTIILLAITFMICFFWNKQNVIKKDKKH